MLIKICLYSFYFRLSGTKRRCPGEVAQLVRAQDS